MSIESVKKQYQDDLGKYANNEKERQFLVNIIDKIFNDFREHYTNQINTINRSNLMSKELAEFTIDSSLDGMFKAY